MEHRSSCSSGRFEVSKFCPRRLPLPVSGAFSLKGSLRVLFSVSDPSSSDGGGGSFTKSPLSGNILSFEHHQGCLWAGAGTWDRCVECGISQESKRCNRSPQGVLCDFCLCLLSILLGSQFFSIDCMCIFMPAPYLFDCCSFVICFEVRNIGCKLYS